MSKNLYFCLCIAFLLIEISSGVVIAKKRGAAEPIAASNNKTNPIDEEQSRHFLSELLKQFEEQELPVAKFDSAPKQTTTTTPITTTQQNTDPNTPPNHFIITQLNEPSTNNVSRYIITDPIKNISTVIYLPQIIIPTTNSQTVEKIGAVPSLNLKNLAITTTTSVPPSAQFQPSYVYTTPLEPIPHKPATSKRETPTLVPNNLYSNPTNNHATVGETENIPSNLFQPVPAETEKPIILRPVPSKETKATFLEQQPAVVDPNNYHQSNHLRESSVASAMPKLHNSSPNFNTNAAGQQDSNEVAANFARRFNTNQFHFPLRPQSVINNPFDNNDDDMQRFSSSVNSGYGRSQYRNPYKDQHDEIINYIRNRNRPMSNLQDEPSSPMISTAIKPFYYPTGFQTSPMPFAHMSTGPMSSGLINAGPTFDDDNIGGMQNSFSFHSSSQSVSTNGGPPVTRTVEFGSNNGRPFGRMFDF